MGQLPPFGECTTLYAPNRTTRYLSNYLQWLASRRVPVRALQMAGKKLHGLYTAPKLPLPLVETLLWEEGDDSDLSLSAVLRCLPNLTAIPPSSSMPQ